MANLKLPDLFKVFANQTRIEIATLIVDNCMTASEISERLQMDLSTIYRHLQHMKKRGILNSKFSKGVERFDFSSPRIYRLFEEAISFISETKEYRFLDCSKGICHHYLGEMGVDVKPDLLLDMRGESCPVPDMQTKVTLSEMEEGKVLLVIVDYPLSGERIPVSVQREGHEFLKKIIDDNGDIKIYIRRK
ncbi:MAG TPA: sulfurtransferase TusA family protein [Mesotoga infera]|nr:sulfurtransferase TusA family protein [Mesotoga infera]HRR43274.1 sulfurtransferase TusA family protein [Mesotoga sp.]HNS66712.1 sulfurtransferase TusA family protein [Mesotoga infera]HOI33671.1 sulfurtransferase TusA family protein [Mesotoga infera]HPD37274.1 sulfurtransferase TusA family protein [Mesotoga infera]